MSNLDLDDPVQARLVRIFDAKRRDNANILSALKVAEDSWERLNKEVDTAIGQEFDLISSEQTAVLAARDRLDNPDTDPADKNFVFAGRVFDATSKTGLPQITVRVLRDRDQTGDPLALETYAQRLDEVYGLYFKVARTFVRAIGNPAVMRELTRVGMRSHTLMEWVLRIMANLLRPEEIGPAEAAYKVVERLVAVIPDPSPPGLGAALRS